MTGLAAPVGQMAHAGPGFGQARAGGRADRHGLGKAVGVLRALAQQAQRARVIGHRPARGWQQVAVGLVHQDQVGHLHDAALDPLQFVAARRRQQQDEQVRHLCDQGFGLADAHRLDQDHVMARGLAQADRLARAAGDAAQMGAGRAGPDIGARVARQKLHPRLVPQDRTARPGRGRIDRQHRDAQPLFGQHRAERLDEGRLAHPRRA